MRHLKVAGLATAAVLALAAVPKVEAQTVVGFGVAGGVAMPMGDFKDFAKMGIGGGAGIGIRPNGGAVGIRIAADYFQFSEDGGADGAPKAKYLSPMASLTYRLASSGSVSPYVIGGAGIMRQSFDGDSESAFAWQGGAGLSFGTGTTRFFVEAAYRSASKNGGTTSFVPVIAGVSFTLSK